MKSIVVHAAKDLRIEECSVPAAGKGEILIRMETGGICGSDLHYFNHGGFGTVRLKEPMILGHEVAGRVEKIGGNVVGFEPGQLVAVSPSRPCYKCGYCVEGSHNHCMNMRFYGSAMPFPHIQGAFSEFLVADPRQCVDAEGLTPGEAAMAEPLAVVLHAARRAGDLMGKRVLVTGCGPIGMLAILVARAAGALEVVATDVTEFTLSKAMEIGADRTHNVAQESEALSNYASGKGYFDVLFECSGIAAALSSAITALRPGAIVMQLGLGGDMTLPIQAMTAKEIELRGSFRFHGEFKSAVEMMQKGRLDVTPLITQTIPLIEAKAAFQIASDRNRAIKTQIALR